MAPSNWHERFSLFHRASKSRSYAKTLRPQPTTQGPKILSLADVDARPTAADPGTKDPPPEDQNLHEKLWDDAYDSLEKEEETTKFVEAYVKTLAEVLREENAIGASDASAEIKGCRKKATEASSAETIDISTRIKDRAKRQEYMRKLVDDGKARVVKSSRITKAVGEVADATLLAKPIVDVVLSIPQAAPAALPWAGFCIGLQMLSNPAKAAQFNREGMTHVVNRMHWYAALTEYLLNTDNADASFKSTLEQLEQKVTELYKAILLYQMKSVCSYYKHQGLVFLQTLLPDKWVNDLATVQKVENDLLKDWDRYDKVWARKIKSEYLELTKSMESSLVVIHQDLREFIDQQQKVQMENENKECLTDLHVVNPKDDMARIEREKEESFSDAYKWIFETEQYTDFTNLNESDHPSCRLLWVKGHAGTGKTMLLIGIIRKLSDQPAVLAPALSYFFCQGQGKTDPPLNNATATIRSLIWMLLIQQPDLISCLHTDYNRAGRELFRNTNAFIAMCRVFEDMLTKARPVYFVVDALDECENGLEDLIRLISRSLALSDKVRWLVSSRPEVDITTKLRNPHICRTVDLNAQNLDSPVNQYIEYKLSALRGKEGYTEDVLTTISDEIHQRAENTFLWVALVFKTLDSEDGWDAIKTVENIPPGLSELYGHMMTRIENQNEDNQRRCKNVLVATTLAYRPLSLYELEVLAELPSGSPQKIVKRCGSFLTINEGMVSRIHQSAQDYLRKDLKCMDQNHESRLQIGGVPQGHADITRCSIDAMSKRLNRNIYGLRQYGLKSKDIVPPDPDPLTPVRYSCVFWLDHLREVIKANLGDSKELCDLGLKFLREHFLHWLESLSLLNKLSEGIVSIRELLSVLKLYFQSSSEFLNFLMDAERFASSYGSIIDQVPLQTYGAALVFCPTQSEMKKWFWEKQRPPFIRSVKGNKCMWDSFLKALEAHKASVSSVAFSQDGTMLASASDDKTIRLWDPATGAHKQTLEGHKYMVNSVAFSHDGTMLASASDDKTIRLWDPATGTHKLTLEGHKAPVNSVAFSQDGTMLASASYDKTIRLWDPATGTHKQALEGHKGQVRSVAFSHDGMMLASASDDRTVRFWDPATGTHKRTLEGHKHRVRSVAFSHDGTMLASASYDKTIRLWDPATGTHKLTLEGHKASVRSVAFSQDGTMLASASYDESIRLWDPATGTHKQTLEGHKDWVRSVAFSQDGTMLASASDDRTIRLWDPATGTHKRTHEGHQAPVISVAFSQDGTMLASASDDRTIRLWDPATGAHKQTLEGHEAPVHSVTFSQDGTMLASASYGRTVRLWDPATGTHKQTLEGHKAMVNSVTFSHDGRMLASASDDRTIRLWDPATGTHKLTLKGHKHRVRSVAFSHDGTMLASASYDKTIRLWDPATGTHKQTLEGHKASVRSVAFSQDGTMLASASYDKTIRLWDPATGTHKLTLEGHKASVNSIAFSQDGTPVLSITEEWIVRGSKPLVWLPADRRATSVAVFQNTIVLGHNSGGMSIIEIINER